MAVNFALTVTVGRFFGKVPAFFAVAFVFAMVRIGRGLILYALVDTLTPEFIGSLFPAVVPQQCGVTTAPDPARGSSRRAGDRIARG